MSYSRAEINPRSMGWIKLFKISTAKEKLKNLSYSPKMCQTRQLMGQLSMCPENNAIITQTAPHEAITTHARPPMLMSLRFDPTKRHTHVLAEVKMNVFLQWARTNFLSKEKKIRTERKSLTFSSKVKRIHFFSGQE